jgi:ribosome-dependent ATPase
MMQPVSTLEGGAAIVGEFFPTTYFMIVSIGTFTKSLSFSDLGPNFLTLAAFFPALTLLSVILLRKQAR